ncbi:MAG: LytTR family transcriptional regulator DNA-binding domain-containing protein [Bacteroidetes bacterium]|nr:LytTR family transcriptional regulator DNA-binding domain-containing protein [Bacteroidota bacterium]
MRKIVIINDNNEDALLLQELLQNHPDVYVADIFSSLAEAAPLLTAAHYDILISSISILSILISTQKNLPILICIGVEEDVPSASAKRSIFAWLHPPFTYERVLSLIQNAERYMVQLSSSVSEKRDYVFIKSEYKLIKINLADILYLSGMRDYTQVFLKGKTSPVTTLQNLKDFETKLPGANFIRVHRSYIIALNQVDSICRNEIHIGTHIIPIGNAYRSVLDEMIEKNS